MLKVYNTLTRRKEDFIPLEPGKVKMYVCGVTVYDDCHIGHGRAYVCFDVIRRWLEYRGYQVAYVQNFTDIDDKIIARAAETGASPSKLAEKYTAAYFKVADRLNIKRADYYPKATEFIPRMVEFIQRLVAQGFAYQIGGDVYFSIEKFPGYGKLSHRDLSKLKAGARVDVSEQKKDPLDFALWKAAKEGEPFWESPWSRGRPGWHIECSVMSMNYLGEMIDIHGGGADLIFPHHENEIAQSEALTGKSLAKYWLHNGFVNIDREKMSKSLGNILTLEEIFKKYEPMALRFYLLQTNYRSSIDFSCGVLDEADKGWRRLAKTLELLRQALEKAGLSEKDRPEGYSDFIGEFRLEFNRAMDDDFNTARALAIMFDLVREANRLSETHDNSKKQEDLALVREAENLLSEMISILGLVAGKTAGGELIRENDGTIRIWPPPEEETERRFFELVHLRDEARRGKKWQEADELKKQIAELGYNIEDTKSGLRWSR